MRKIIISGWYGQSNTGDEAILSAIMINLQKVVGNVEFIVLSPNPQNVMKQYNVKAINLPLLGIKNLITTTKAIKNADLFILGGGGLLFDWYDKIIPWNIIKWLKPVYLAKLMRKPVMIYALGVGPIHTILGKVITRIILNKVDLITVRDLKSKKILDSIGINKPPVYVTIDPAILLSPPNANYINEILSRENIPKNRKLVGISVRPWPRMHSKSYKKLINVLARVADYIVSRLNAFVVFIPMQFAGENNDNDIEREIFCNMCYKKYARILSNTYNPQELLGIIGRTDMVIGMRLHSLIFAAATNVPMIGLAYDPKVKGFLEMIDQEKYSINVDDVDYAMLVSKIDNVWNNKEEIKANLKSKMSYLIEDALFNTKLVKTLILKSEKMVKE
ncbi:MAG: polysaccharide pyruvyl transferase CsaB [Thermoplasmata archaeon]|nr:polysaccharide pyruvyl transferase CsaB [Thermoplasmata archaeon]